MLWRAILPILTLVLGSSARAELGDILWTHDLGEPIFASPTLGRDGTIYVGSNASTFVALRHTASEASEVWSYTANDWIDATAAVGSDGTIYFGTYDSTLVALSSADGSVVWETTLGEAEGQFGIVQASPAIHENGLIVVSTSAGFIHGILPSGEEAWVYEIGADTRSSPAIDSAGRIYFGADDGIVYCLNELGENQWTFSVDGAGDEASRVYGSPALDADGNVYIGAGNGSLYALTNDGQLRWKFDTPEAVDVSPAIDADGNVYFASRNGSLYCVNSAGTELWSRFLGDIFYSSPVIDANGFVYITYFIGSGRSGVVCFSQDGQEIWETEIEAVIDSSLVITVDGVLLVGAFDGNLYALESIAPLGYELPWPRFRRDTRGRGRVIETPLPVILSGPEPLCLGEGSGARFSLETEDETDQAVWRRDWAIVRSDFASISLTDVGFYDAIVSNERGEVLSEETFLSILLLSDGEVSFSHPLGGAFQVERSTNLFDWQVESAAVSRVVEILADIETSTLSLLREDPIEFVRLSLER